MDTTDGAADEITNDAEFAWYLDKRWFSSEKCLRDFLAVHAPQMSPVYRDDKRPYPSLQVANNDQFVSWLLSDQDDEITFENGTPQAEEALDVLERLTPRSERRGEGAGSGTYRGRNRRGGIGFPAGDVSRTFEHSGDWRRLTRDIVNDSEDGGEFTSFLASYGWHAIVDPSSKAVVWFLPVSVLLCKPYHLRRLKRAAKTISGAAAASDVKRRGGGGGRDAERVPMASDASSVLLELLVSWTYLQYSMFHLLVFKGLFDAAARHPERWYAASTEESGRSGIGECMGMIRTFDERVTAIQTYIPWWWETFQVGEVLATVTNSRMARKVFSRLHRKFRSEE